MIDLDNSILQWLQIEILAMYVTEIINDVLYVFNSYNSDLQVKLEIEKTTIGYPSWT